MNKNLGQHDLGPLLASLCDESITPEQMAQLEESLRTDPQARRFYLEYLDLHASLIRSHHRAASSIKMHDSEIELLVDTENIRLVLEEEAIISQREAAEQARIESLAAEKFLAFRQEQDRNRRPEPLPVPRRAFYATVGSVAASLIFFVLWMLPDPVPVSMFVASIDDSIDAQWSDPSLSTAPGTQLFTLENLVLTRGVVQIGFEGGAKMIVEAPATLELLSTDSARLEWGKLVGHVPHNEMQLTIKTPQASITDLGTEFGVEVNRQQVTHLHVFEGRVSAATLNAEGKTAQQQTILVDESVYLQPKTGTIEPASAAGDRFVRRLLFPLPLYSTGVDLAEGDDDPHWQIVAAQNVPDFVPQPAVVATPARTYKPNDPQQSQWVSFAKNLPKVKPDTHFTFRTTFDLSGFDPATASIRGSFSVDNQVTAIRVNGTEIPVPKHLDEEFQKMFSFSIDSNLLNPGSNHLELDILNRSKRVQKIPSAVALRVLLEGTGEKIK